MEIFGPPEKHLIDKSTRRKLFFDSLGKPRLTVSSKGRRRRPSSKDLRQSLKCDDEPFLDFVARCLRWDPARRMNPNDAMNHEFITGIKPTGRPRAYLSSSNLVSKRLTTGGVPSSRPLPEPPGLGGKVGLGFHKATSSSPVKPAAKRLSSVNNGMQQPAASKRISNSGAVSNGVGSALPRRNPSGSLAAAAAATSLSNKWNYEELTIYWDQEDGTSETEPRVSTWHPPSASHANILYLIIVCFTFMSNIDQVGNCWFFLFLRLMDVCIMHRKKKTSFFVPSYTHPPYILRATLLLFPLNFLFCFFSCSHGWFDLITTCWFLWCFSRCTLRIGSHVACHDQEMLGCFSCIIEYH